MGTYFRVTIEHNDEPAARAALHRCFNSTRALEARFSRFDPLSELTQLNANAAPAVAVSDDMAALLRQAAGLSALTGGTFDVSAGALTTLWREATAWPDGAAITAARRSTGSAAFSIDDHTLRRQPGVRIDLDGVAKGYAVDRCAEELRSSGIRSALLSLGESSLYALGAPAGAAAWDIAVRGLDGESIIGTVHLRDQALSVSSAFGHERHIGGRRIGHIVDPRSGMPLTTARLAVVVLPSATDAEAWSKALLVTTELQTFAASQPKDANSGALLVQPTQMQRAGHIKLTRFAVAQSLTAAAEPLR
jgi:thiamine biosynthesis lipoprotein